MNTGLYFFLGIGQSVGKWDKDAGTLLLTVAESSLIWPQDTILIVFSIINGMLYSSVTLMQKTRADGQLVQAIVHSRCSRPCPRPLQNSPLRRHCLLDRACIQF